MTHACANCHSIAGTPASGRSGPDLTHVASRSTIAAGTLPMSRGNLMGWIANPQGVKPGVRMPAVGMTPDELHAVASYLETLK
jgi:cytochrome c oxidase subunit 2